MNQITQQQLSAWLDRLASQGRLVAPRDIAGTLLYRLVNSSNEIAWGFTRPAQSAKEFLFPPTDRLMCIEKRGQQVYLRETLPEEKLVLFGVRPCDARGFQTLDALFIQTPPVDVYYARRRENTILVGLVCKEEGPSCFCRRLGGAPDDPSGMDVMLTEQNGGYLVTVLTEKGQQLIKETGLHLDDRRPSLPPAPQGIQETVKRLQALSWPAVFADSFWWQVSERCLSCRVCAYVCPTCRCFDVRDEAVICQADSPHGGEEYERLRCWDSCTGLAYRRTAGGHNPRTDKSVRLRNRFFCKFYYYPEQYNPLACTGCGRCVDACPVNIDITEVLDYVEAAEG